ncbi:proteasome subunit alpha type-1 [Daktulosphaira vitifoliae]|uniref:proteasome subunit alpha type-1 n=1 Tax=Daktulosphaira vitifoliae TaxID=58002 RepID=UPI0021AAD6C7|nr:proteasome subunit alpha type-1 [Daktulosphaira vitifoliae]
MFRNQYDSDVTVWSPQGRLHQVEYAMEAVKLGSAVVALKNKTHAAIIALKRAPNELSAYQKKIIPVDDHLGFSFSGLLADARILSKFMRSECASHKFAHGDNLPVSRLMTKVGNRMQLCTQRYDKRPYGVGLLVAGYDDNGPHIFQTCPSANYTDCKAMAIGSRSQSARTYLERNLDAFKECSLEELLKHGMRALRDTLPNDINLNSKNVSIAVVGKGQQFEIYDEEKTQTKLSLIEGEERRAPAPSAESTGSGPQPPQDGPEGPQDPIPAVAMETE